ncbi:MAG: ABC transporter substrate-binding protein [Chloroflexi bacterium]|nr:ABC transporter substrate-binding protein [Chloroflexota bacterium]
MRFAIVVAALLMACTTPTPTPTSTPTLTATPTPTSTPLPGPTSQTGQAGAVLAVAALPEHLDVHQTASEALLSLGPGIVYSRLLRLKSGSDVPTHSLALECDLCQSWEMTSPTTYLFHLRPGVLWHDAPPVVGRQVTAQDVAYSLERLRTPGWPGAALLQTVASVEAVDALTVEVALRYADADILLALAHGQSKIVAWEAVALRGDLKAGPTIGTGPWVLDTMDGGGSAYRANPNYYESGFPSLERLQIMGIPDASTRMALVLIGRVDVTALDDASWYELQSLGGARVLSGVFPQPGTGLLLGLKADRPPFDRLEVRQALFQALDPWQAMATRGWENRGEVAVGLPLASPDWGLSRQELRAYFGDSAKAQSLVAQAGVQTPVAFTFSLGDFGDKYLALGEAYVDMMTAAGFQPELATLNPREYAQRVWDRGDFQAFLGPMPPVYSPNGFLVGMAHSAGQYAITGYVNPDLDSLILRQFGADEERGSLVRQVQGMILEEAFLFMPMSGVSLWVWHERVKDFAPNFAASEYFHWARVRVGE